MDQRNVSMAGRFWSILVFTSHIGRVIDYIKNQEIHHQKNSFKAEYLELLSRFDVSYDEKYVFDFFDRGAKEAPNGAE
jgi:hypothetical protein